MTADRLRQLAAEAGFEQIMKHKDGSTTVLPDALFERFAALVLQDNQAPAEAHGLSETQKKLNTLLCGVSDFLRQDLNQNRAHDWADRCEEMLVELRASNVQPKSTEPHGWIVWWPAMGGGHKPVYTHGAQKPSYGPDLGSKLRLYPVYDAAPSPAPAHQPETAMSADNTFNTAFLKLQELIGEAGTIKGYWPGDSDRALRVVKLANEVIELLLSRSRGDITHAEYIAQINPGALTPLQAGFGPSETVGLSQAPAVGAEPVRYPHPDEDDPVTLWKEIRRLRAAMSQAKCDCTAYCGQYVLHGSCRAHPAPVTISHVPVQGTGDANG